MKSTKILYFSLVLGLFLTACGGSKSSSKPAPDQGPLELRLLTPISLVNAGDRIQLNVEAVGVADEYMFWDISGDYPRGISLLAVDRKARIQGVISEAKSFKMLVTVKDQSQHSATLELKVEVKGSGISITTTSLPDATQNKSYSASIEAFGGSDSQYTWTVDETTLPPGLVAQSKEGQLVLTGVPTEAGFFELLVEVRNAAGQITREALPLYVN